ncbi:MAG: exodeoxyribonuclease V subunit gamma [Clostridia bacterium]|nr:exodeoxyribonuclease V subunit gamma [Clostridia bacterium]
MKSVCVESNNFVDIFDMICNVLQDRKPLKQTWIVPIEMKNQVEWKVLDGLKQQAMLDVKIVSFSELANEYMSTDVISLFERTLLMQKILILHKAEFQLCKLTSFAMAEMILDSIDKLRKNCILIDDLKNCIPSLSGALKLKITDICLAWQYYLEFKGDKLDELDKLDKLATLINDDKVDDCFIFYGWSNFSKLEQKIISSCMKKNNTIVGVCAPLLGQNNADCYTNEVKSAINDIIRQNKLDVEWQTSRGGLNEFSSHILSNVMSGNYSQFDMRTDNIRLFSASSVNSEVELLAQEIKYCIYSGARYRDCVVVCPALSSYSAPIKKVFSEYEIPYSLRENVDISVVESIKFVLIALECVKNNFALKDICKFIFHPYSSFSKEDRNTFEEIASYYAIEKEAFVNFKSLPDEDLSDIFFCLRSRLQPLLDLGEGIKKANNVGDIVSCIQSFLVSFEYEKKSVSLENGEKLELNKAGSNKILRVLEMINNTIGDQNLDLAQLIMIFKAGLGSLHDKNKTKIDEVIITNEDIIDKHDYVFIVGAIEGNFPSTKSDVSFIDDNEISLLAKHNIYISPSTQQENIRAREKTILSIATATKRLTLSYPLKAGQEKCEGAGVFDDLCKCVTYKNTPLAVMFWSAVSQNDDFFGGKAERYAYIWQNKENMLLNLVQSLSICCVDKDNTILAGAYRVLNDCGYGETLNKVFSSSNAKDYNLNCASEVFFYKDKVRVTQIEKFFDCPYAHFVDFGLLPREKGKSTPQAVDIGNIIHMVLEKFGKLYILGKIDIANIESTVGEIFDKVISLPQFSHLMYNPNNADFFRELKFEAIRACLAVNNQLVHGQYKLKYVEASFGSVGFAKIPQVKIDDNKTIFVVGKLDRADVWGNRIRLIDYKTSKNSGKFNLTNFYLGKKIQLFYYLGVLHKDLGLQPGGAYYMPVHREYSNENGKSVSFKLDGVSLYTEPNMFAQDDQVNFDHPSSDIVKFEISVSAENKKNGCFKLNKRAGVGASENQFNALLDYSQEVLNGAICDLWRGEIRPLPIGGACAFCKYKCICKWGTNKNMRERDSNFSVGMNDFFEEKTDEV